MDEAKLALVLAGIAFFFTLSLFLILKYQLNHSYHASLVVLIGGAATLFELLFSLRAYTQAKLWSDEVADNVTYLFLGLAIMALIAFGGWMKTINQQSKPRVVAVDGAPVKEPAQTNPTANKQTSES